MHSLQANGCKKSKDKQAHNIHNSLSATAPGKNLKKAGTPCSAQLLTRKHIIINGTGRFSDLPPLPAAFPFPPSRKQWLQDAGGDGLIQAWAYSSGHCPGFSPGSLLCSGFRKETGTTVAKTNVKYLMTIKQKLL